jgi:hypothetical protein
LPAEPPDPDDEPTDTREAVDDVTIEQGPETSGSVDVSMSDSRLVKIEESASARHRSTSQIAVEKVEDVVSSGVGKVGVGMGKVGAGLSRLGARVDKLPGVHRTRLGTGVIELGAGISEVGANLKELPRVARTRRGRVLVRSLVVGFLLVFAWITVIIYFQLRGGEKPDLRPRAEQIMVELRNGEYEKVFAEASPRFQEITDAEQFARTMTEMKAALGGFREIAAINDTILSRGPGGLVARVDLQLDFDNGRADGTISLHRDEGKWKFLGIGVDLPDDLVAKETSKEARSQRVKAPPEVRRAAERVLELSRDGRAGEIWDTAAPLFQKTVTRADFERIEAERRIALGRYIRILDETRSETGDIKGPQASTTPGGTGAWLGALVQFDLSNVSTSFGFSWIDDSWKLSSYVVVLPMPRAPRSPGATATGAGAVVPVVTPLDAAP